MFETRLCTHAHMCTLRMDPGRKKEGSEDKEQERQMGKKEMLHTLLYMKVDEGDCGRKGSMRRRDG